MTLPRGVVVLGVVTALMVGAVTGGAVHRAKSQAELSEIAMQNCQAIEALKAARRQEAIGNYRRLERDAGLLGITLTPELRKAALEGRNRTLRRFAPSDC